MSRPAPRLYLVAYDIAADRRRKKVMKALEAVGLRVNFSVFEARLTAAALAGLLTTLDGLIDARHDHIRVYPLPKPSIDGLRILGKDRPSYPAVTVL
jgi:CRISPR-associated protein Cas2